VVYDVEETALSRHIKVDKLLAIKSANTRIAEFFAPRCVVQTDELAWKEIVLKLEYSDVLFPTSYEDSCAL